MSKRLVVAALVVVTLAGLGLWGFVLRTDQGGAAGAAATKSDRGGMRTAGAGAGPSREAAAQAQGLSSKEIQAIRDGLGKAAGAAGTPGATGDRQWPKAVADLAQRSCESRARSFVPPDKPGAAEQACACALPTLQRKYPDGPPPSTKRKALRDYSQAEEAAIEDCVPR